MAVTTLAGYPGASGELILESSTEKKMSFGAYMETADGRGFRYCRNGTVATVPGKVYQGPALDATNMQPSGGLTPAAASSASATVAAAIGATQVTIASSITLDLNALAGGYMSVDVTPGQGYTYRIKGNTLSAGTVGSPSAGTNVVVYLDDPIVIGLTTSSRVIFVKHPYDRVVIEPGTPTANIAGVSTFIIGASVETTPTVPGVFYYGWLQTRGACSVLFTGTGIAGKAVGSLSGGTSGSVAPAIAATNIIGYHMATGITTEYAMIYLVLG